MQRSSSPSFSYLSRDGEGGDAIDEVLKVARDHAREVDRLINDRLELVKRLASEKVERLEETLK
jgi:hypothetical protein